MTDIHTILKAIEEMEKPFYIIINQVVQVGSYGIASSYHQHYVIKSSANLKNFVLDQVKIQKIAGVENVHLIKNDEQQYGFKAVEIYLTLDLSFSGRSKTNSMLNEIFASIKTQSQNYVAGINHEWESEKKSSS